MQELALVALLAQPAQPVLAHDGLVTVDVSERGGGGGGERRKEKSLGEAGEGKGERFAT